MAPAWPYAAGHRHLGHVAGFGVPSDVFARYHRLRGNDVLMVSGTDEHGTPVMVVADREGKSYVEVADYYNASFREDFRRLGLSYDLFSRTTTLNHERVVQDLFGTLYEHGAIIEREMLVSFSPATGHTLPDRYIEGTCPICGYPEARGDQCDNCGNQLDPTDLIEPRSRIDGSVPEFRETKHLFLDLPQFADRLRSWISSHDDWRPNVKNFSLGLLDEIRPRPITRDLDWGVRIPIPGYAEDEQKRIYVWFDAVIGYLSASIEWAEQRGEPDAWREWWQNPDSEHFYFQGKDNIVFHTVIWPAMLLGYGEGGEYGAGRGTLQLPGNVVATEFLTMEGKQFSSSRGYTIFVRDFLDRYDPDALRYYLVAAGPETQDTDFTWAEFVRRNNDELLANWGNLVNRTLTNAHRTFGAVPEPGELTARRRRAARGGRRRLRRRRSADRARPLPGRARGGDADLVRGQPVRERPGAVGAREDRPRARRHGALRLAPRRRQPQGALHAVPAAYLAAAPRAARLRRAGWPGRSSSARSSRRKAAATRC